jgi:hypothetical protein
MALEAKRLVMISLVEIAWLSFASTRCRRSGDGLQELIGQSGQHEHRAQHRHPRRKTL